MSENKQLVETYEEEQLRKQCQIKWDKSKSLRDEFFEFETYLAYAQGCKAGTFRKI